MYIYAFCGFLTVITPHFLMFMAGRKDFRDFLSKNLTVSNYSMTIPRKRSFASLSLFLNGIWSIGFFTGLLILLKTNYLSTFGILSFVTLYFFFASALTLNPKRQKLHGNLGMILMSCLTLIKVVFGLSIISQNLLIGLFSSGIGLSETVVFAYLLVKNNLKLKGSHEVAYTTILSVWVLVLSLYMII